MSRMGKTEEDWNGLKWLKLKFYMSSIAEKKQNY